MTFEYFLFGKVEVEDSTIFFKGVISELLYIGAFHTFGHEGEEVVKFVVIA